MPLQQEVCIKDVCMSGLLHWINFNSINTAALVRRRCVFSLYGIAKGSKSQKTVYCSKSPRVSKMRLMLASQREERKKGRIEEEGEAQQVRQVQCDFKGIEQ